MWDARARWSPLWRRRHPPNDAELAQTDMRVPCFFALASGSCRGHPQSVTGRCMRVRRFLCWVASPDCLLADLLSGFQSARLRSAQVVAATERVDQSPKRRCQRGSRAPRLTPLVRQHVVPPNERDLTSSMKGELNAVLKKVGMDPGDPHRPHGARFAPKARVGLRWQSHGSCRPSARVRVHVCMCVWA